MIATALLLCQIVSSVLLIIFIVMQSKGTGLSSAFGGEGMFYRSKRGVEKLLFRATIGAAIVTAASSILLLVLK